MTRHPAITFVLPFPPSVNEYYRAVPVRGVGARNVLSAKARKYRETAVAAIHAQQVPHIGGRLRLIVAMHEPNVSRDRDLDNHMKGIQDAIQHAGVIDDDHQFDVIGNIRRNIKPPHGLAKVHIRQIAEAAR